MNLMMNEVAKNTVYRNPYQFLLEDDRLDINLRQLLYIRFLKQFAKPPSIFQNLNESLHMIDTILEILSLDRLTFYDLAHSRDQKFVVYNLLFEYLRVMVMDNWRVKYHVFKALQSFIESIEPNNTMFLKYMTFFEELVKDNKLILSNKQTVQTYVNCILTWVSQAEDPMDSHSTFLIGILPKLVRHENEHLKENQQIVLSSIFSAKNNTFFNQFKGQRLQINIKSVISEDKTHYFTKEIDKSDVRFIIPDERIRFLAAFVQTLLSCVEANNPLLERFCQNIFPLEFFESTISLKSLKLDLRLPLLNFLIELHVKSKHASKVTYNYFVDTLVESCIMKSIKDSIQFFIDRFPLIDDVYLVKEDGIQPLSNLHESNIMCVANLLILLAEKIANTESSLKIMGPKLADQIMKIKVYCSENMKALPNSSNSYLDRLFGAALELRATSVREIERFNTRRFAAVPNYKSVNLGSVNMGSIMNLSRAYTKSKISVNMMTATTEFTLKPLVTELYNMLKSEEFLLHYEKNFKSICTKLSEFQVNGEPDDRMRVERIGCALIQSLCNDRNMVSINSRMYLFCFKWLKYYLMSSRNLEDLRERQNLLLSYKLSYNLSLIFKKLKDTEVTVECIDMYINLLNGRNQTAQMSIISDITSDKSQEFLVIMMGRMRREIESIVEEARKTQELEYKGSLLYNVTSLEDLDLMIRESAQNKAGGEKTVASAVKFWRFLELLCAGQFSFSQEVFGKHIIETEANSFIEFSIKVFGSFSKYNDEITTPLIRQVLNFLIETVRGPNARNQKRILQSKFFDHLKEYIDEYQDMNLNLESPKRTHLESTIIMSVQLALCVIEGSKHNSKTFGEVTKNIQLDCLLKILQRALEKTGVNYSKINRKSSKYERADLSNSGLPRSKTFDKKINKVFQLYFFVKYMSEVPDKDADHLFDQVKEEYRPALEWLEAYTGKVEVMFQGNLEVVFFVLEPASFMWSSEESIRFVEAAGQKTYLNRMYLFIEEAKVFRYTADYMFEIAHSYGFAARLALELATYVDNIILVTAIISSLATLFTDNFGSDSYTWVPGITDKHVVFFTLRLLLLVLSSARVLTHLLLRAPLAITIEWNRLFEQETEHLRQLIQVSSRNQTIEPEKPLANKLRYLVGLMRQEILPMSSEEFSVLLHHILCSVRGFRPTTALLFEITKTIEFAFATGLTGYYLCMLVASVLALYYQSNLFVAVHLMQLLVCSDTLGGLVQALRHRASIFAVVYMLILVFLLIAAEIAFHYFAESFFLIVDSLRGESREQACRSAIGCFLTVIDKGLRNRGGVGDSLLPASATMTNHYYGRYAFDTLFYLVVNFIGLSLLAGTVVDGLAELRLQRERVHASKTARCFMCDLERGWFDRRVNGFDHHSKRQHKLRHYLAFIYGLKTKPAAAYSGVEKAIVEQLLRLDISWLPNSRASVLEKEGVFTEKTHQADELVAKLAELHQTVAEIEL